VVVSKGARFCHDGLDSGRGIYRALWRRYSAPRAPRRLSLPTASADASRADATLR
jgi:hypothetical protein